MFLLVFLVKEKNKEKHYQIIKINPTTMRKEITLYRFALAVLSVALCGGCAKTTTDEDTENLMPMRFGLSEISTRAAISGVSDLQQEGQAFSVWGTYARTSGNTTTGPTFTVFDGTPVTYKSTAWTYDNPQYWFPGFTYNFRALYPSTVKDVTFDGSALQIKNFDGTQSIDLLVASPNAIPCSAKQTMPPVSLNFRHLLSKIGFTGILASDASDNTVTIIEAKIYGMRKTGNWNNGWNFNDDAILSDATSPYASVTNLTIGKTTSVPLFSGEKAILMFPQEVKGDIIFEITYRYAGESVSTKHSWQVKLSELSPEGMTWEAGKAYNYRFTIPENNVEFITFGRPTIEQWNDLEGGNYNIL